LIEDLREVVQQTSGVIPKAPEVDALRNSVTTGAGMGYAQVVKLFGEIDPQIEGVLKLLRAEIQERRRQHELIDTKTDQPPAAYRPAVADYFEQLSRDYKARTKTK
jgi:hypothetical protein